VLLADACAPVAAREPCFHYLMAHSCNISQTSCVGPTVKDVKLERFQEFQEGRFNSGMRNPDNISLPGGATLRAPNC
jgi:hypothetical protein